MAPAVADLKSTLLAKMGVFGYFALAAHTQFISRHAPYMQGNISSVLARLLTDVSEPNMMLWSCQSILLDNPS